MQSTSFTFPCQFPVKIIGKKSDAFEGIVIAILNQHVPDLGEGAIKTNYSGQENYISMTATITATSQEQLDNLYKDLSKHPDIIMAL
jgi:putative lipoic acid-binding regulatory protein